MILANALQVSTTVLNQCSNGLINPAIFSSSPPPCRSLFLHRIGDHYDGFLGAAMVLPSAVVVGVVPLSATDGVVPVPAVVGEGPLSPAMGEGLLSAAAGVTLSTAAVVVELSPAAVGVGLSSAALELEPLSDAVTVEPYPVVIGLTPLQAAAVTSVCDDKLATPDADSTRKTIIYRVIYNICIPDPQSDILQSELYKALADTLSNHVSQYDSLPAVIKTPKHQLPLKIINFNFQSVKNNIAELGNLINSTDLDIITGTETWLNSQILNAEIAQNSKTVFFG